ncbi:MAG: LamG domain-containing protein, partial [Candidatus Gracilibacteria bacterium]|nr:LamG domain-containing protein [Candidatus Gracilibacteria bacterium]
MGNINVYAGETIDGSDMPVISDTNSGSLLGSWDLNGDVQDSSGNENHAIAHNIAWDSTNGINQVGSFNGTNTYVDTQTQLLNGVSEFTISTWVKLDSLSGDDRIVSTWGAGDDQLVFWHDDPNGLRLLVRDEAYKTLADTGDGAGTILTPGEWYHVTAVMEAGGNTSIYLNGELDVTTQTGNGKVRGTMNNILIGKQHNKYTDGDIGLVKIYDTALTQADIQSLYQQGQDKIIGEVVPENTTGSGELVGTGSENNSATGGLVGSWDLNGDSQDSSGNGNHAMVHNISWESTDGENSVGSFNGTNTYIDTQTQLLNGVSDFTISTWVNLDSVSGDDRIVSSWGAGDDQIVLWHDDPNGLRLLVRDETYKTLADTGDGAGTILTPGEWYHVTAVMESGGNTSIYLNGELDVTTQTGNGNVRGTMNNILIGKQPGESKYTDGDIGLVKIYNTALELNEIQSLYQEGQEKILGETSEPEPTGSGTGELIGSWDLNGNAQDSSGNNNHGVENNITYEILSNGNKVAVFDGGSSVQIPQSILTNGDTLSISGNFYTSINNGIQQNIFRTANGTPATYLRMRDGKLTLGIAIDGSNYLLKNSAVLPINTWYNYTANIDGNGDLELYLNGELQTNTISLGNVNSSYIGTSFYLGSSESNSLYLNGKLSQTKIYNRLSTIEEVDTSFQEGQEYLGLNEGDGLVGSWDLNGNALDSSGNGNDGVENNITYKTLANGNQVASFNGSSSKINLPNPIDGKGTISYTTKEKKKKNM